MTEEEGRPTPEEVDGSPATGSYIRHELKAM